MPAGASVRNSRLDSTFATLLLCFAVGSGLPFTGSRVTKYTLYVNKVTWPEAQASCASGGEVLLNLEIPYKTTILRNLFELEAWKAILRQIDYSVWIGFYDILPPHQLLTWTNSCELLDLSAHGIPQTSADMRCGETHQAEASWRIQNCNEQKMFICESHTDARCNYTIERGAVFFSFDINNNPEGPTDLEYCLEYCSEGPHCWATYLIPGACVYFIADYPTDLWSIMTPVSSFDTYIKDCVEDVIISKPSVTTTMTFPLECYDIFGITSGMSTTSSMTSSTEPLISSSPPPPTVSLDSTLVLSSEAHSHSTDTTTPEKSSVLISKTFSWPSSFLSSISVASSATQSSSSARDVNTAVPTTKRSSMRSVGWLPTTTTKRDPTKLPDNEQSSKTAVNGNDCSGLEQCITEPNRNISYTPFRSCSCSCRIRGKFINMTSFQKEATMMSILESLTVNTSRLSSTRRRRTSVVDPRPSAKYVGAVGVAMLVFLAVLIVFLDIDRMSQFLCDLRLQFAKHP